VAKDQVGSVRDGYSQIMAAISMTLTAPDVQAADLQLLGKLQSAVLAKLHLNPQGAPGAAGQPQPQQGGMGGPPGAPPGAGGPPPPQGNPMNMQPGQGQMPMSQIPNANELRALMASRSGG
jgi:hypothetical protein